MTESDPRYLPGVCNIGGEEISKRRKELAGGLVVTFVLTAVVYFNEKHLWSWIVLFISAGFTALMYFQVKASFCVVFGILNRYNFGKRGRLQKANDPGSAKQDRRKVILMTFQTLAIAILYTGFVFLGMRLLLP